jgi:TonB family protein
VQEVLPRMMRESSAISRLARRCLATAVISTTIPAWVVSATTNEPTALAAEHGHGGGGAHVSRDFSGVLPTGENQTLRLNTDLGSVRIVPLQSGASPVVRYSVHIETDARGAAASMLLDHYLLSARSTANGTEINGNLPQASHGAQFWVHFEVAVPASYSLDVYTGTGDIQTFDVGGTATLVTEGGNIVGGRLGTNFGTGNGRSHFAAKLQTQGGHIQVDDVVGDLTAFTAGGHINTGHIYGEANLHSGGGHIRAAGIDGTATLVTEGGNITVGKAAKFVAVKTGGGQIDFGEVKGSVHAQTGGGGIRVMYVSGPMDVESSGGSICLTRVSGSVKAATDSGTITAWINPDNTEKQHDWVSLPGASQLTSTDGDIVVFLPKNLAANIEAIVERGGAHRIEADPALALQYVKASSQGPAKAFASLNGGGAVLRLKTTGGKIKLQYMESEAALWNSMMQDQQARMERELATPAVFATGAFPPMSSNAAPPAPRTNALPATPPLAATPPTPAPSAAPAPDPDSVLAGTWVSRLENRLLGGVREDGDDFWRHIKHHPNPVYPDIARKAGVEGTVRLQVRLKQDGKIEVEKILEGDTLLADAAIAAVKQWRGKPVWMDEKPVDVISTVTFRFKLRD